MAKVSRVINEEQGLAQVVQPNREATVAQIAKEVDARADRKLSCFHI